MLNYFKGIKSLSLAYLLSKVCSLLLTRSTISFIRSMYNEFQSVKCFSFTWVSNTKSRNHLMQMSASRQMAIGQMEVTGRFASTSYAATC